MKCEIIIDKNCEEKIVIYAKHNSNLIEEIKSLAQKDTQDFVGYKNEQIVKLNPFDVYCVTVIDNKVYAILEKEKFLLKERLYVIEEKLPENFVKVNQSCIANIKKIDRFDASISGTLKLFFKNGYVDYVSRRQLKNVKERIGI